VTFTMTAGAGTLGQGTVTTDASGEARTTLTTNRQTTVRANAGAVHEDVTINVNVRPTITLTAGPNPVEDQPVTFTVAVNVAIGGSPIQEVAIDYGDGDSQSLGPLTGSTSISHTYRSASTYTVRVTARDVSGETTTQTLVLSVARATAPGVSLTANPTNPTTLQVVTFTATATVPTGDAVDRYIFDFGDGSSPRTIQGNATTQTTTWVYESPGRKTATVRVVTLNGQTGTNSVTLIVKDINAPRAPR
jgi:hypothetical protein